MKVIFRTNIDNYKKNCFPSYLTILPRIGESVRVTKDFETYFSNKGLPNTLEVVDVTYTENEVVCDLWYRKIDIVSSKLSGANLF